LPEGLDELCRCRHCIYHENTDPVLWLLRLSGNAKSHDHGTKRKRSNFVSHVFLCLYFSTASASLFYFLILTLAFT